jgi:hypothetical protein
MRAGRRYVPPWRLSVAGVVLWDGEDLTGTGNDGETSLWQGDHGGRGQDAEISAQGELEAAAKGRAGYGGDGGDWEG